MVLKEKNRCNPTVEVHKKCILIAENKKLVVLQVKPSQTLFSQKFYEKPFHRHIIFALDVENLEENFSICLIFHPAFVCF